MKKYIFTLFVLLGFTAKIVAQDIYVMNVRQQDGTITSFAADSVAEVTFDKVDSDYCYQYFCGTFSMVFVDYDAIQTREITLTLPEEDSADYGKKIYVDAPAFLQGSNSYDLRWTMEFTYDETTRTGTVAIIVDDNKIGKFNDEMNLFWRLDNLPASDAYITGDYKIDFTAADLAAGHTFKRANRSQNMYIVASEGETFTSVAGQLNIVADVRLTKK